MKYTKPLNDWFDINCESARRDFNQAKNTFNRSKDDETRRNFTRMRTRYNKIKKKAKQCFKIKEGLAKRDSRAFWKIFAKHSKRILMKQTHLLLRIFVIILKLYLVIQMEIQFTLTIITAKLILQELITMMI